MNKIIGESGAVSSKNYADTIPELKDGNDNTKDLPGDPSEWNKKVDLYIWEISHKCVVYRRIHERAAILYEKRYSRFALLLIFVSFIIAVYTSLLEVFPPFQNNGSRFFLSLLSLFLTLLVTINKFLNYQEVATQHRVGSERFLQLNKMIAEELLTQKNRRKNARSFINRAGSAYFAIRKNLPYAPKQIVEELDTGVVPDLLNLQLMGNITVDEEAETADNSSFIDPDPNYGNTFQQSYELSRIPFVT